MILSKLKSIFTSEKKETSAKPAYPVKEGDAFIVSYPKSGTTWLSFLVANYINNNKSPVHFKNLPDFCPEYETETSGRIRKPGESIVFKSHSPFNPGFNRVIYLVRDGRDVAVSYYFYHLKYSMIDQKTSFPDFFEKFNTGKIEYGLWNNHVNSWLSNKPAQFLLVKYEDLLQNAEEEFSKVISFINLPVEKERILAAISASKFEELASIEKKQINEIPKIASSDTNISFIRKGIMGDYMNYFDKDMETKFWNTQGDAMKKLGYTKS